MISPTLEGVVNIKRPKHDKYDLLKYKAVCHLLSDSKYRHSPRQENDFKAI